ncbi:MAG: GxxExxY protein [Candidatus Parabeggiatoa sp. nov. 3]|nr:MAG: GxxExxY protein [Gammaproteobacteria bacterium]RKZ54527.1 MAG: GxxExxY protein [Gammaproteobacteria bacterium]RKZ74503.1 MAG: GxxExxY protein [Gammaproteobacteria bacterium]HEW98656.1 GxxExxY protein [Beggiatoa sp.]
MAEKYLHSDITNLILRAFYKVYNQLGYGFLEKVYENAMLIELRKLGLYCKQQEPIKVYYDSLEVGNYFADIIVNDVVILELKATEGIREDHLCQLVNYLKATNIEVGLLLNFGLEPQHNRRVFSNSYKM